MRALLIIPALAAFAAHAPAQPGEDPPPAIETERAPDAPPPDLERIRRRVEEANERAGRLAAALERLEAGAPLNEAINELRPDERRYFVPWSSRTWGDPGERPRRSAGERGGREDRPDGARPPRPGPEGEEPQNVTPQQVRAFIRDHMPEMNEHLSLIEQGRPEAGERMLARLSPRISEVIHAQRRDERLGQLKLAEFNRVLETIKIAREAREAIATSGADATFLDQTRGRLRAHLLEQAKLRAQIQQREIELLEAQVEALRAELAERESERDQVVEEMTDQMMRRLSQPGARGERRAPDN
jgi:hypothetical protein